MLAQSSSTMMLECYAEIAGQRQRVATTQLHQPRPHETRAAFERRMERLASELRVLPAGSTTLVVTRYAWQPVWICFIDVVCAPAAAPLPKVSRGTRGGRTAA
jgi:hypothetical protein